VWEQKAAIAFHKQARECDLLNYGWSERIETHVEDLGLLHFNSTEFLQPTSTHLTEHFCDMSVEERKKLPGCTEVVKWIDFTCL